MLDTTVSNGTNRTICINPFQISSGTSPSPLPHGSSRHLPDSTMFWRPEFAVEKPDRRSSCVDLSPYARHQNTSFLLPETMVQRAYKGEANDLVHKVHHALMAVMAVSCQNQSGLTGKAGLNYLLARNMY